MKIHLNPFDRASVRAALEQVEAYRDKVSELPEKLVEKLTKDGAEIAQEMAIFMEAYDTGELVRGIVPEVREKSGSIVSTAPHSAFVEMGTGIRGAENPNPNNYLPGWTYDVNQHGEKGWWYTGRDGKRHWTQGMPHRPFMYETAKKLRENLPSVARELMKEEKP